MSSSAKRNVPVFNGENYFMWKFRVRELIEQEGAGQVLIEDPPTPITEEWTKWERFARGTLIEYLDDSIIAQVPPGRATAKNILAQLDEIYACKKVSTQLCLQDRLFNCKLTPGSPLKRHMTQIDEMVRDLISCGGEVSEVTKVWYTLNSLPSSYAPIKAAIKTMSDDKITLAFVKGMLLEHEEYLVRESADTSLKALHFRATSVQEKQTKKFVPRNKHALKNKHVKKCFHCGRTNHIKRDCYFFKQSLKQERYKKNNKNEASASTAVVNKSFAFMMCKDDHWNENATWNFVLDSGATEHIIHNFSLFTECEQLEEPIRITVAKIGTIIEATHIGRIKITTSLGYCGELKNVLYSKSVPTNLISVRRIQEAGMSVLFTETGDVEIMKGNTTVIKVVYLINMVSKIVCQQTLGDRNTRDLATILPEFPQGDADTTRPQLQTTDPCNRFRNVDEEKKEFYSPAYPDADTYPSNTDCVLVLTAKPGNLIKLDFRDWFAIEPSTDCKNDYLEVRDGAYGYNNLLERPFCGFSFPPELTSTDRHLWIHFKSDENIEYKGFRAVYEFIPRSKNLTTPEIMPCEIYVKGMEKLLSLEDIEKDYKNFTDTHQMPVDCIWIITVKVNWKIQLQFIEFSLEKPNDCESNFVDVFFGGGTDVISKRKTFCGSIANTVYSDSNSMFVRFYAEKNAAESNFKALFTAYRENEKTSNTYIAGCADDEFDCEDATCISQELRCNHNANCRFSGDESDCEDKKNSLFGEDHIVIIMVIFSLILSGMCFTFIYNCVKKLIRDHHVIQEYIRQSREQQLNELDKEETVEKKLSKVGHSRSNSSSSDSHRFDSANAMVNTPCYVPGGELLPILIRNEHSVSPPNDSSYNQDIYTVDNENMPLPEMCDSACQTRESLFTTHAYSSGHSTPNHSIHSNNVRMSPPAPFSTFGYKKDNSKFTKFRAEAKIEMGSQKPQFEDKRRPYSVQTTKSAPDVIVTH